MVAVVRAGLIDPRARRRRDRKFRRWERGGAMELWQMDVVGWVLLVDGTHDVVPQLAAATELGA